MKKVLDLNSTYIDFEFVNSTIINRNIGNWYNLFTIDKGESSNIKKGDAVINSEGLIGKIESVSKYYSKVKLLTNDDITNKVSVKINIDDNDYIYGILIGYNIEKNIYEIEGINEPDRIKENSYVTTTGLTENFPAGLLIGRVKKVVMDEFDLNSIVEVEPSVNFNSINYVTVLGARK